jgi:hypothetical protein
LPGLVDRLISGLLAARAWPDSLETLDAALGDEIASTLAGRLGDAAAAIAELAPAAAPAPGQQPPWLPEERLHFVRRTLTVMVELLARHSHADGIAAARAIIADGAATGAPEAALHAARAAAVGLINGDPALWQGLTGALGAAPGLLRAVLLDLADDPGLLMAGLTDDELARLWELLERHWPYQAGDASWTGGLIGPEQQAQHWRDGVLGALARRGTDGAVLALDKLAAARPDLPWLSGPARDADELRIRQEWAPPTPEELTQLLEDNATRLVRGSADLTDLIVDAIAEAAGTLVRTGQLLWNDHLVTRKERGKNVRRELWRTKSEPAVGAWLADQLTAALARRGVVVSREVLVRQTTTRHGLAVDVQADAPLDGTQRGERATCRIELKGNWNDELMTAMRAQLADDYLIPEGLRHGVYVTAWFDTDLWNDTSDSRRSKARSLNREAVAGELAAQAEDLRRLDLDVRSVIIDISRPAPSARKV